jgi:hypothetical protein
MGKKTIEHIRFTKVDAFKSHFIKYDGIFFYIQILTP